MKMQPNMDQPQKPGDEVAWWFKLLTRGIGTVGGIVAMVLGLLSCLTIHSSCLVAGILEICIGFMAVVLEAPCCCPFLDFIDKIGEFSQARPYWQKGALYTITALVPIVLCISVSTVLGCLLVFGTGVLYGMMALGKKASREEMMTRARSLGQEEMKAGLVQHEQVNLHVPDTPAK